MSRERKAPPGGQDAAATIRYRLDYREHPWATSTELKGSTCWVLVRELFLGQSFVKEEPVAVFNLDSEGSAFELFLRAGGCVRPRHGRRP